MTQTGKQDSITMFLFSAKKFEILISSLSPLWSYIQFVSFIIKNYAASDHWQVVLLCFGKPTLVPFQTPQKHEVMLCFID